MVSNKRIEWKQETGQSKNGLFSCGHQPYFFRVSRGVVVGDLLRADARVSLLFSGLFSRGFSFPRGHDSTGTITLGHWPNSGHQSNACVSLCVMNDVIVGLLLAFLFLTPSSSPSFSCAVRFSYSSPFTSVSFVISLNLVKRPFRISQWWLLPYFLLIFATKEWASIVPSARS